MNGLYREQLLFEHIMRSGELESPDCTTEEIDDLKLQREITVEIVPQLMRHVPACYLEFCAHSCTFQWSGRKWHPGTFDTVTYKENEAIPKLQENLISAPVLALPFCRGHLTFDADSCDELLWECTDAVTTKAPQNFTLVLIQIAYPSSADLRYNTPWVSDRISGSLVMTPIFAKSQVMQMDNRHFGDPGYSISTLILHIDHLLGTKLLIHFHDSGWVLKGYHWTGRRLSRDNDIICGE